MNSEEFTYWLQGALEMNPEMLEKGMSPQQVKTIQDHLNLVFNKVTPDRFDIKLPDYNSTGNPPPILPSTTCEVSPLFCEAYNQFEWEMAQNSGGHGLIC